MGSPAKVARDLSEQEKKWKTRGTQEYMELAHLCVLKLND
jgi:phenylacetic acid degradation protein